MFVSYLDFVFSASGIDCVSKYESAPKSDASDHCFSCHRALDWRCNILLEIMTPHEILKEEMELIRLELTQKHIDLGMKASGDWVNTIEAVTERLSGRIIAKQYTEQLVDGRKPGKFPPRSAIEKWIVDKGIQSIDQSISISSLAFLIARKIAREGTEYFKQGGTDLVSAVITPERIQKIIDRVSTFQINSFTSEVKSILTSLAA